MGLDSEQLFWLIAIAMGGGVLTVWAFLEHLDNRLKARTKLRQTEAREETRREIAAYVAEGSISPDDAAKLMAAGGGEGLDGVKASLRDAIAKGARACCDVGKHAAGVRVEVHTDDPKADREPGYKAV